MKPATKSARKSYAEIEFEFPTPERGTMNLGASRVRALFYSGVTTTNYKVTLNLVGGLPKEGVCLLSDEHLSTLLDEADYFDTLEELRDAFTFEVRHHRGTFAAITDQQC